MPLDDQSSGFWDANAAPEYSGVIQPFPSDSWTVWAPGNDTTVVPTSDPSFSFDPFKILTTGVSAAASAATAYNNLLTQKDSIKFAAQDRANNALLSQATLDLKRQQIQSQAGVDMARIAAQTDIAKRQFAAMPGLTTLFGGTSPPAGTDWLMLALTAVGVYFAWRAVGKHG